MPVFLSVSVMEAPARELPLGSTLEILTSSGWSITVNVWPSSLPDLEVTATVKSELMVKVISLVMA